MKTITCYQYDPGTGIYLGERLAQENPKRPGVFMIPEHATEMKPPVCGLNEAAVMEGSSWTVKPDYRGCRFWSKKDQGLREIAEMGVLPDPSWTAVEPRDADAVWDQASGSWTVPFEVLRDRKLADIRGEAGRELRLLQSGFSQAEIISWSIQEEGANALLEDAGASGDAADFVRSMAEHRGVDPVVLAVRIRENLEAYRAALPAILGRQQRREDLALEAKTIEELEAI